MRQRAGGIDLGQEAGAAIGLMDGCHWPLSTGVRSSSGATRLDHERVRVAFNFERLTAATLPAALLAAILLASSFDSNFAADRRSGSSSKQDIRTAEPLTEPVEQGQ